MNIYLISIIVAVVTAVIAFVAAYFVVAKNAGSKSSKIIREAEERAEMIKKEKELQAKEKFLQMKAQHESLINERNSQVQASENRIKQKETSVNQKENSINQQINEYNKKNNEIESQKKDLIARIEKVNKKEAEIQNIIKQQASILEKISGYTAAEAREKLTELMKDDARAEAANVVKDIISEAKITANQQAKKIVIETIQRTAVENAVENAVSVFNIENDEVKGRIIGREGRNIRALESLTGVEVIIDDTPDAIIISGFDPVRREIARQSLHKLVTDGRIHPARIEEVVGKVKKQIEQEMTELGKKTAIDLGIHGMNIELIKLIGRMKYRSSYGQNLLQHSKEVAILAGTMAAELGLEAKKAKRAGLLHDIGKVAENEQDLPHAILGMKVAEKYGEKEDICNAIGAHHDECEMTNIISPIIQICDSVSGARPGARREVVEAYMQRLNKLEELALQHNGVIKTYAIQAGRELRVIVAAEKVSDSEAAQISLELSKKIQEEMIYPGQIKITVIRETRAVNFAK